MTRVALFPAVLVALSLMACPGSDEAMSGEAGTADSANDGGGACVPGQTMACECEDGAAGGETCAADGAGYGACVCDGTQPPNDSGDGANDDGNDDGNDDSMADAGGSGDSSPGEITWSGDIVPFMYDKCGAGNDGCHSSIAYQPDADKGCLGWASFEDGMLGATYSAGENVGDQTGCPDLGLADRLIERSPWQCGAFMDAPTQILIVPGDADASYMVMKMEGTLLCDDGVIMPPPDMPPEGQDAPLEVTQAEIQMVRDWIDAGAIVD